MGYRGVALLPYRGRKCASMAGNRRSRKLSCLFGVVEVRRACSSSHEPDPSHERQDIVEKRGDVFQGEIDDEEDDRSSERDTSEPGWVPRPQVCDAEGHQTSLRKQRIRREQPTDQPTLDEPLRIDSSKIHVPIPEHRSEDHCGEADTGPNGSRRAAQMVRNEAQADGGDARTQAKEYLRCGPGCTVAVDDLKLCGWARFCEHL